MTRALRIGIDENGLGPRLGPMVVTAALVEMRGDAADVAREVSGIIDDSKVLCAHGDMARVEALVLAMLEAHTGAQPRSYDALRAAIGLQGEAELRSLCPDGSAPEMCFGFPLELPAFGGDPGARERAAAESVRAAGMTLVGVRQAYACAKSLNVERAQGRSRFDVDLSLMIELAASLRERAGSDLEVVCGKVGGRKSYGAALTARWPLVAAIAEAQRESSYKVPGVGVVRFTRDADASDPAVALASLYGKYARELSMARIHGFLAREVPGLRAASGYHDPVTTRYIEATSLARRAKGIADECFER